MIICDICGDRGKTDRYRFGHIKDTCEGCSDELSKFEIKVNEELCVERQKKILEFAKALREKKNPTFMSFNIR